MGNVGAVRSLNKQQQLQSGALKVGGTAISKRFIQSMQIYGVLSVSGSKLMRVHCLLDWDLNHRECAPLVISVWLFPNSSA